MSAQPSIVLTRKLDTKEIDMARTRNSVAAATLVAVGAIVTGVLSAASPANANADNYVALAYSFRSDIAGMAKSTDAEQARIAALKNCQDNGGNHCVWFGTFANECAALAILGAQEWSTATGPELRIARNNALQQNSGSRIATSGCAGSITQGTIPVPTHTLVPTSQ
jgi:hypothetical protein